MSDARTEPARIKTAADIDAEGHMKHWLPPVLVALIGAFMSILDSSSSMLMRRSLVSSISSVTSLKPRKE